VQYIGATNALVFRNRSSGRMGVTLVSRLAPARRTRQAARSVLARRVLAVCAAALPLHRVAGELEVARRCCALPGRRSGEATLPAVTPDSNTYYIA